MINFFPAIKNKVIVPAGKWNQLKIILSDLSQSSECKYHTSCHLCILDLIDKNHRCTTGRKIDVKSSGEERGQMGEEEGREVWGVLKIQTNLHINWYSKN